MVVTDRDRWINKIIEVFKFFISICEENHLTYFIAYGSAIGAVRHHGFIPWDDDVDVVMPRPDYERFLNICENRDMGKYQIVTPQNTPNYYLPFTKLCDSTTTLLEKKHYRCILGIFIDIFIIDGIVNDPKAIEQLGMKYDSCWEMIDLANSHYSINDLFAKFICKKRISVVLRYLKYSFNRKKYTNQAIKTINDVTRKYDYNQCEYVVKYPRGYGNREVLPKSILDGKTMMQFETIQVALPKNYDKWLRHIFGDYMQLPPENERVLEHSIAYYNLDKRESLDEVLKKIK